MNRDRKIGPWAVAIGISGAVAAWYLAGAYLLARVTGTPGMGTYAFLAVIALVVGAAGFFLGSKLEATSAPSWAAAAVAAVALVAIPIIEVPRYYGEKARVERLQPWKEYKSAVTSRSADLRRLRELLGTLIPPNSTQVMYYDVDKAMAMAPTPLAETKAYLEGQGLRFKMAPWRGPTLKALTAERANLKVILHDHGTHTRVSYEGELLRK